MDAIQTITPNTKPLRYDIRKFKTITSTRGAASCWVSAALKCHAVPPRGDERSFMVLFSVGLQLEHCVGQGSLTIANQDGFFQRKKGSEKSTGLPDQTALTRQWASNSIVLKNQKHTESFPLKDSRPAKTLGKQ